MQDRCPKLKFPPIKLRAREVNGSVSVWDAIRRSYVALTPEEWVRQHLCSFLLTDLGFLPQQISLEYPVAINGQSQRADVVVLSRDAQPLILVECKAPQVAISQSVLDQAVRYNSILGARYVILTNGVVHHLYRFDIEDGSYSPLSSFEELSSC